jgi:hypothetical protein
MSTCNNSPLIRSLQAAALQMSTQLLRTCTRSSPLHDHAELLLTYPRSCSLQVNSTHIKVVQRDRTPESSTSVKRLLCMHQQPPDPLTMPNMVGATACPLPSNPPPQGDPFHARKPPTAFRTAQTTFTPAHLMRLTMTSSTGPLSAPSRWISSMINRPT